MLQKLPFDLSGVGFQSLTSRTMMLQRRFNWQLVMPSSIGGILGMMVSQYCQDVRFGDYSMSDISSLRYGGFQKFYAGMQNIETVLLQFLTPVDNSVIEYFHSWYDLVVDKDGFYNPKNVYAKPIYVMLYDRSGVESVQFELTGTWPSRKPVIDLTYRDEDMLMLPIYLSVDRIKMGSIIRDGVRSLFGDDAVLGSLGGLAATAGITGAVGGLLR